MIIIDTNGIAAINWEKILWKHAFEGTECGYLELESIKYDQIIAKYYDHTNSNLYSISFNIQSGKYDMSLIEDE